MTQIELQRRYPDSRPEDITDAYMRGFEVGLAMRTDENAKLREQNRYLMKGDLLHVLTDQELAEQQRREREMQASIKALDAENVKLRELVRIAVKYCDSGTCDGCPIQGESGSCPYSDIARELGIEVDA